MTACLLTMLFYKIQLQQKWHLNLRFIHVYMESKMKNKLLVQLDKVLLGFSLPHQDLDCVPTPHHL